MLEAKEGIKVGKVPAARRSFGQILSRNDFEAKCLDLDDKICAIGLLPANYGKQLSLLRQLSSLAAASNSRVHSQFYYSWINTTCHPYLLSHFDVPQDMPTILYMHSRLHWISFHTIPSHSKHRLKPETIFDH